MAYSQIRTRSGRIIKNKKCFCCKQSKLITKASARTRRNVKKDERPTLSELENLAKASIKQTQQHKRKLEESSTSGIRKTLSKKSHLIEENERDKQPANKNDSRFSFGKNTQENQISNNLSELMELVLNLNENGIGTHLNQELLIDPENQMKPQNKSEKKVTEDINNETTNENQMKTQNKSKKKVSEDLDNKTLNENQMEAQNKSEMKEKEDLDNKTTDENQMKTQNESENKMTEDLDKKTTDEEKIKNQNKSEMKVTEDLDNKTDKYKMKTQNESEKNVTEDLYNKTTNEKSAQNLSERYYIHEISDYLNKTKIQKEFYKNMTKCEENKITVEKLKANLPRRSVMRDFFDSLNKGQIRNPEESENLGEEKQMRPKIESEKRMTENSENKKKENQSEQSLPRISLINDLLNFFNKERIFKLEDNEILVQHKIDQIIENSKKTPADTPKMKNKQSDDENKNQDNNPMEESNLETLHKIRGQMNSKQIDTMNKMMTDLITTLKEKQNNISKMLELNVDVSQDPKNYVTLIEERNRELLLKILEPTEKETNNTDFLQELPLEDEINAEVSLQESLPEQTNNDFLLREYLSEESNFNPPLQQLQVEGPTTEIEEDEEIKNLEEITVYLTIQETDIESNELQFQEQNDSQNNDQNKNTSEQHQNNNNEQNNISSEQNQNRNDDQSESDSQSSDQSHSQNNNASTSTENGENKSPGESNTNNENDRNKVCIHIQRIRVFYVKNEIVKLEPIKEEMNETEPKPGFSGTVENKEAREDVKNEESDHVLDSGVYESGSKFTRARMPRTNTNTYLSHQSSFVFQIGRPEKTQENQKQRAFIKDLREGKITMFSNENETFDEDEGIYCIICGKRNLKTRYIFINLDEVDYGSLSAEEILERYWYDDE